MLILAALLDGYGVSVPWYAYIGLLLYDLDSWFRN
jgi:hypothetical protein